MNRINDELNEYEMKSIDRFVELVQRANFNVITESMSMGDATALILEESRLLANGLEYGFPNDPFDEVTVETGETVIKDFIM